MERLARLKASKDWSWMEIRGVCGGPVDEVGHGCVLKEGGN